MVQRQEEEEEEIVASGEALRTVAGWLGVGEGEVDGVMEKEGLNPEFEAGRTQGLGLGAKFLPHSKAVALVAGVEQRLGSKLKRSSQAAAAGVRGHHALLAAQHGKAHHFPHGHAHDRRQQQQAEPAAAARGGQEEEEDSEEEGRGAAFGKGGKGAAARKPAAFNRSQLLAVSGGGVGGKKRKRKGGGGRAAGGRG
ncbi:hypothetical protein ABPG75_010858 [Micractinium tetrahymenae]